MPGGPFFNCYPGPFSNVRCNMALIFSSGKQFLDELPIALNPFHDNFENFVELVGR